MDNSTGRDKWRTWRSNGTIRDLTCEQYLYCPTSTQKVLPMEACLSITILRSTASVSPDQPASCRSLFCFNIFWGSEATEENVSPPSSSAPGWTNPISSSGIQLIWAASTALRFVSHCSLISATLRARLPCLSRKKTLHRGALLVSFHSEYCVNLSREFLQTSTSESTRSAA